MTQEADTATAPEYDQSQVALKMNAAKVLAVGKYPYLHAVLFAMTPVCVPGLGTFASDVKWRMYYDPVWVMEKPVEQIAGLILHEAGHCIRGHGERAAAIGARGPLARIHNIAGDALINCDLRDDAVELPEGGVYIESLQTEGVEVDRSMSTEQIYNILREKIEDDACTCDDQPGSGEQGQDSGESPDGDGDQGGEAGDQSGDESGNGSADGGDESGDQSGDQAGNGSGQPSDQQGNQSGSGKTPCPIHDMKGWDCGSAADGVARDYEMEGDKVDGGVDDERADVIRRNTAREIREHVKNRGNVAAGWKRWSDELLDPVVDWRKELASIVRHQIASISGIRDYTYRRPSRRQAAMKQTGNNIILPAMRKPEPPKIAIVFDSSGSMSDSMIGWSLSECQAILRGIGSSGRNVSVVSCDAQASKAKRAKNLEDVEIVGGGGTDMRVGIDAALAARDKPEIIIVLTDGGTPWPDEPVPGTNIIVGLTDESTASSIPPWMRTINIVRT